MATSAATGFFKPVTIGKLIFVDGALGANNPVDELEEAASNIWCKDTGDLKPQVGCFISIGTGNPGKKPIHDKVLRFFHETLVRIATETEYSAKKFIARWRGHYGQDRYFRFNVDQGLQDVGLHEYKEQGRILAATQDYLNGHEQVLRMRNCVQNLLQKGVVHEHLHS